MRTLRTLSRLWGAAIGAEMEYRANFVLAAVTSAGNLAGAIFSLGLFYQHGYQTGDWTWSEVLLVIGVYTILDGVQSALLLPNYNRITEYIREGQLDFVLLKPIDSQFFISLRNISLWGLPNIALGVAIILYAGAQHEPPLELSDYLSGIPPVLCSLVILYSMGFILGTLAIWFVKLWNLNIAMRTLVEAGRLPITAYPGAYRLFFTVIVPVAFMTTVPAEAMSGRSSWAWLIGTLLLAGMLFLASRLFWRYALRFYTSASS